jgi:D-beta-D-heptose 7-phosphate kinase/D-beta-D-heptose 1-phosphate adenosyltransferase
LNMDIPIDISSFSRCHLLVVGDMMIDEYLWGTVDRISPEAPVQVVCVAREDFTPGGAGNVANNLVALGARVSVAGVIGPGADGQLLRHRLADLGADTEAVLIEGGRPTTRKTRVIAANQQVLRIDRETKNEIGPETVDRLTETITEKIPSCNGVLISDYGKGLITRELVAHIVTEARRLDKFVLVDPKGLDFTKYDGATILTPNQKEATLACGLEGVTETDVLKAGEMLLNRVDIQRLLVTCGKDGMLLFEPGTAPQRIPAQARQVFDVSGAGDTVLAVLALGLCVGACFSKAAALANAAAGIVVEKLGTATVSARELSAAIAPDSGKTPAKLLDLNDLSRRVADLRNKGLRIVMTNGCFDLVHAGHIALFSEARKMGDVLIVAIDDDASVRRLKGPGRPVIRARERAWILSALDNIDYVTVFSSRQLRTLIQAIRPEILVKGSNYNPETVVGADLVQQFGGQVAIVPIGQSLTASKIIDRIRSRES